MGWSHLGYRLGIYLTISMGNGNCDDALTRVRCWFWVGQLQVTLWIWIPYSVGVSFDTNSENGCKNSRYQVYRQRSYPIDSGGISAPAKASCVCNHHLQVGRFNVLIPATPLSSCVTSGQQPSFSESVSSSAKMERHLSQRLFWRKKKNNIRMWLPHAWYAEGIQ